MTSKLTQTERDKRMLEHIDAALALKPRDSKNRPLKSLLTQARDAIAGKTTNGDSPTHLEYENAPAGAKVADPNRAGLLLRVGARTGRQWIFRYVHPTSQKQTELIFARFPETSVADARTLWEDLRLARNEGRDPARALSAITPVKDGKGITLGDLVQRYLDEYARPMKKASSAAEDERILRKHLAHYLDAPATSFGPEQVAAVLRPYIKDKPNIASKIRIVLRVMFDIATGRSKKIARLNDADTWLPPDYPDPTRNVSLPSLKPTNHTPTEQEMTKFLNLVPSLTGHAPDILTLTAQTMTRISETCGMAWAEIDLDRGQWLLPKERTKNGDPHLIFLPTQAVARLRDIKAGQEASGIKTAFVFPQKDPTKPTGTSAVQHAFNKQRASANLPDSFKIHSVRHYALTWLAEQKQGRDLRDRMSNHRPPTSADAVYTKAALNDPAREWWQNYANFLDGLAGGNVVSLPSRTA